MIVAGWIVLAAAAAAPIAPTASAVTTDAGTGGVRQALPPNARAAFDMLRAASTFESAHIGYGGTLSENARAVRTLIREPEAPRAFQTLYDSHSPVPVLYALTAFWYLRPDEFMALVKQARERFGSVRIGTMNGCIRDEETVAEVLERSSRRPAARRLAP